jgi:hypothetical protein
MLPLQKAAPAVTVIEEHVLCAQYCNDRVANMAIYSLFGFAFICWYLKWKRTELLIMGLILIAGTIAEALVFLSR